MEMQEMSGPIRYVYCLVDKANNRFKLGSTPHKHYAYSVSLTFCPHDSFQVGYVEEYALVGERVIRERNAEHILSGPGNEATETGIWMHIACFEVVRATLSNAAHVVPPTLLVMVSPETTKALACEALDKLLGLD